APGATAGGTHWTSYLRSLDNSMATTSTQLVASPLRALFRQRTRERSFSGVMDRTLLRDGGDELHRSLRRQRHGFQGIEIHLNPPDDLRALREGVTESGSDISDIW